MISNSIQRLNELCSVIPPLLEAIPENEFSAKPAPEKWSKKQILGHLIDSTANNHQRFVRIQFEDKPIITYDQNNWVNCSYHQEIPKTILIAQWKNCNLFLAQLISNIPTPVLRREGFTGGPDPVSIEWLVADYVQHMEHHLKQIVAY